MANMNFPFPIQQELTAIALAYTNQRYIADLVLPRTGVGSTAHVQPGGCPK